MNIDMEIHSPEFTMNDLFEMVPQVVDPGTPSCRSIRIGGHVYNGEMIQHESEKSDDLKREALSWIHVYKQFMLTIIHIYRYTYMYLSMYIYTYSYIQSKIIYTYT